MENKQELVHIAVTAGEILLENGAEIYRVQDTIEKILDTFGFEERSIYVIANGIFVSVDEMGEDRCFSLRNVSRSSIHLGRIDAVNSLSRDIAGGRYGSADVDTAEIRRRLGECASIPALPVWLEILASGVGSGGFCYLINGNPLDSAAAFVAGILLRIFLTVYKREHYRLIPTLLGASLVSLYACLAAWAFPALNLNDIVIGSIIPLLPGVSFTTAIRNFFSGHYISGNIQFIDAVLTGVCIAIGVIVALQLWAGLIGGTP